MSAFYDLASLVVVPSGYKASKVYAQKPLTTDGQLTFSRASTATRVNASGLIETVASNVPRLDYTNSTCPKLLLEPSRTNTALHNSDFTNAVWQGSAATVVANQAVSPDGTTTADLIYPATSGNFAGKYQNLAAGTTGVLSCYVKQAGKRFAQLGTDNNATYTCAFDLQLGTVVRAATNYTGTITSVGNGWYRITAAYVSSAGAVYPFIGVSDDAAGAATIDGTNGLYVWGFQYEVSASYATSVIPTTTAAVTRLADAASKTGISSLLGATEGVVFLEVGDIQNNASTGSEVWYFEMRKDQNNSFGLASGGGTPQPIRFVTKIAGTPVTETEPAPFANSKIAIKYTSTQFKLFRNGTLLYTTNKSIGDYADIEFMEGAGLVLSMILKQFLVFPTALSDSDCIALTA